MLQVSLETPAQTAPRRASGARRSVRLLRAFSIQALILALTVAVLDAIVFFTLSDDIGVTLPGYRQGFILPDVIGRGYPHGYFEAHPERGFDIKPSAQPRTDLIHYIDDYSYNIWSNSVGCFDGPIERVKDKPTFWYVAGDSIAWGHTAYEDLMSTIVERIKGVDILKCAVTHTGQRHQFAKFLEIGKQLGRWPARVLVVYSPTDTANDYMHPHSTVVDGGLTDTKMLDANYNIVPLDAGWFDRVRAERAAAKPSESGAPTSFSLSRTLLTYSITAQLANAGLHALNNHVPAIGRHVGVLGDEPLLDWFDKYVVYKGQKLYDLHRLTHLQSEDGYLKYENFKYAAENKAVIKEWRDHALANGYSLEFVLPHPGNSLTYSEDDATNFYKEFMAYLSSLGIKYHDLIAELKKRNVNPDDLFWVSDSHMSVEGNEVVGEILAEIL
jgi:hypothetical protein